MTVENRLQLRSLSALPSYITITPSFVEFEFWGHFLFLNYLLQHFFLISWETVQQPSHPNQLILR
jgi:hypothetical protein